MVSPKREFELEAGATIEPQAAAEPQTFYSNPIEGSKNPEVVVNI